MDENIFSDLGDLGIDISEDIDIYKKPEEKQQKAEETIETEADIENKQKMHIYEKEVKCPVCEQTFKVKMVKTSSPRILKKDSDFFVKYDIINPYFYDVWLCNFCGYASLKTDFSKIKEHQKAIIASKITSKWQGRSYPDVYDANIAIERYKLALYNSVIIDAHSSTKAMICLKISWIYRMLEDTKNELLFAKQSIDGFADAFNSESTPIYGMDHGTLMYLVGELYRRQGDFDNANVWFSKLITAGNVEQKIKEMARTQRDVIKEDLQKLENEEDGEDEIENNNSKKGFFSKLFKR